MKELQRLLTENGIQNRLYESGKMRVSKAEFTVSANGQGRRKYSVHTYDKLGRRRTYTGRTAADVLRIAQAKIATLS